MISSGFAKYFVVISLAEDCFKLVFGYKVATVTGIGVPSRSYGGDQIIGSDFDCNERITIAVTRKSGSWHTGGVSHQSPLPQK